MLPIQKNFTKTDVKTLLPMFSSRSFIVSGLIVKSYFILNLFLCMVWESSPVWFFCMYLSSFPSTTYWRDFSPLHILAHFVIYKLPIKCGFISVFSILFHWSMCLFFCQYHIVLISVDLQYSLNSWSVTLQLCSLSRLSWLFWSFVFLYKV